MVVGKNVNKALTRPGPAPKLPPLKTLTLRRPDAGNAKPCISAMAAVLGCWASHGSAAKACIGLETALRECVDTPRPSRKTSRAINSQLSEHYHKMKPPTKRR